MIAKWAQEDVETLDNLLNNNNKNWDSALNSFYQVYGVK